MKTKILCLLLTIFIFSSCKTLQKYKSNIDSNNKAKNEQKALAKNKKNELNSKQ